MGAFFGWDRLITPIVVKILYWVYIAVIIVGVIAGIAIGIMTVPSDPMQGAAAIAASLVGGFIMLIAIRISCELALIFFRIHDHLRAIRARIEE